MKGAGRRAFVCGAAAAIASVWDVGRAHATLVRGLTLRSLVDRSEHVVLLRPLESYSSQVEIGGRLSIVTDTRVRIEELVAKPAPRSTELLIRTLGGRIGKVGEIVHGQPELAVGEVAVAFLKLGRDDAHWVVGMAQGHYPLDGAALKQARLTASRNLPSIRDWQGSAVQALAGQTYSVAQNTIRRAVPR